MITGFAEENAPPGGEGGNDDKASDDSDEDEGDDDDGSDSGDDDFAENGLKAHNMFRKIHEADEMKLDDKMCKEAEEYAKKLADMGSLQHADTDYGENLAMKCSSEKGEEMTGQEATKNW